MRLLHAACLALGLSLASSPAFAKKKLRIATLAPKNSSWGKVFRTWEKAISQKSKGELELDIYYNSVQGNEDNMVGKMKTGQLDGAALTSVGLSQIHRDVLVQQLPGVVDSWALLDKVRAAIGPDLDSRLEKAGFVVVGWGDIGLVRQMTKGFEVRRPSDMKRHHPLVWRGEPIGPTVYAEMGGVVSVPLGVPEVLPALRTGKIDVINAPALAAEQLQWAPHLDHVASTTSVCAIGATVLRKKALDGLPADLKEVFWDIQKRSAKITKDRVRKLDAAAYQRLSKKMTVVNLSAADRAEWKKVLEPAIKKLSGTTFSKDLVEKVLKVTGKR